MPAISGNLILQYSIVLTRSTGHLPSTRQLTEAQGVWVLEKLNSMAGSLLSNVLPEHVQGSREFKESQE